MQGSPTSFWGKLRRDGDAVVEWHPLFDHCTDVAAVAEALLQETALGTRLAHLVGQDALSEGQIARLGVLAFLHDVGKLNRGFQAKGLPNARDSIPRCGHVKETIDGLFRGGLLEALALEELDQAWGAAPDAVVGLFLASVAHHGSPLAPDPSATAFSPTIWKPGPLGDPIGGAQQMQRRAREQFPAADAEEDAGSPGAGLPASPRFQHAFAGLVMLADWLGSDTQFFPYSEVAGEDRSLFARERAAQALQWIGLLARPARVALGPQRPAYRHFCPFEEARPMQRQVAALPVEPGPSLSVLEAQTGSGKTEAALMRYAQLFFAGEVDGLYFALPTRTAALQLYERVCDAVERLFASLPEEERPPVVLAVPGYLRVDGHEGRRLAPFEVLWHDDEAGFRRRSRGWAAERPKRFLAGAVVVGTVDQLLLAGLRREHAHLRACCALRHLLVVDEVHASDLYMNRLLMTVLRLHFAAGGHALLMSATLGASSRELFLGLVRETRRSSLSEAQEVPYPLLSYVTPSRIEAFDEVGEPAESERRAVEVQTCAWLDEPELIARAALEAAARGAKVLVLRNTVRACIDTQRAVVALAKETGNEALLFACQGLAAPHHSRFCGPDRHLLDRALVEAMGKRSPAGGRVVVATQTVQQSLDLDADWMITDLCPMDVLLQRLGRLHRHRRPRPDGFERARALVLVPEERDLGRFIQRRSTGEHGPGFAAGPHGIGYVYADLRVLEATLRLLEEHGELVIPEMARELVERSTHPEALEAIVRELGEPWGLHQIHIRGAGRAKALHAERHAIDWSQPYHDQPFDREMRLPTRLGLDDRRLLFETPPESPFGAAMPELRLPGWMAERLKLPPDAAPSDVERDGNCLRFSVSGTPFVYDALGFREAGDLGEGDE